MQTFINSGALGFTNLSSELPNGLLLTEQHNRADFLVCTAFEKFAVCLETSSGFRAIKLDTVNDAWRGCFITGIALQADTSTGFTSAQRDIRPGDLVINDGGVLVATRPVQLGHLPMLVKWSNAAPLGDGTIKGGFGRWRVIRIDGDVLSVLKEVNSQEA